MKVSSNLLGIARAILIRLKLWQVEKVNLTIRIIQGVAANATAMSKIVKRSTKHLFRAFKLFKR